MAHELEVGVVEDVPDVVLRRSEKVVQADDGVSFCEEHAAQVRPEESGATSDENTLERWPVRQREFLNLRVVLVLLC